RLYQERKRRARGARPRSQSFSRTKPWETTNMSRRTWERHRKKARDANSSAAIFLSCADGLATARTAAGEFERGFAPIGKQGDFRPKRADGATMAADTPMSVVPCWAFGRHPVGIQN